MYEYDIWISPSKQVWDDSIVYPVLSQMQLIECTKEINHKFTLGFHSLAFPKSALAALAVTQDEVIDV